jgi:protein gp37
MSKPLGHDAWWDFSYNPVVGCLPVSPGCTNCYAAQIAGTYSWPTGEKALHYGLTVRRGTRRIFNGKINVTPPRLSVWPLRLPRAPNPKLGPGQPYLIFVVDMGDLFYEDRPTQIIDRAYRSIGDQAHAARRGLCQRIEFRDAAALAAETLARLQRRGPGVVRPPMGGHAATGRRRVVRLRIHCADDWAGDAAIRFPGAREVHLGDRGG